MTAPQFDRCTNCVLPLAKLAHDENGVCAHCQEHQKTESPDWKQLEQDFLELVEQYRGKGDKYDFMVLLTGGKDSSFVLYYLLKKAKARVLAFTWDNGMIRESAWANIRQAVATTNVEHHTFRFMDLDKMKRVYSATYRALGWMCFCPQYAWLAATPTAIERGIPIVITGFSEGQRYADHDFKVPSQDECREAHLSYYGDYQRFFEQILREHEPAQADELLRQLLGPMGRCVDGGSDVKWPVFVPLANYVDWMHVPTLERTLAEEIGYKKAAEIDVHTSCFIEPIRGHLEFRQGLTDILDEISCFVRNGTVSRDDGLRDTQSVGISGTTPENLDEFLSFVGITREEFEKNADGRKPFPPCLRGDLSLKETFTFLKRVNGFLPWLSGYPREKRGK